MNLNYLINKRHWQYGEPMDDNFKKKKCELLKKKVQYFKFNIYLYYIINGVKIIK